MAPSEVLEDEMKETGIIMSGDHPLKCIDGSKPMTRRTWGLKKFNENPDDWVVHHIAGAEWEFKNTKTLADYHILCPYGQVGDLLWVRETWRTERRIDNYAVGKVVDAPTFHIWYKTTSLGDRTVDFDQQKDGAGKWRPSIHMPRWASRIERTIALLRAERLRDISEADAKAEGDYTVPDFIDLFLRINHLPDDANPWNWVIGW